MKKPLILGLGLLMAACGSSEKEETLEEKIEATLPKSDQDPCDYISAKEIMETFQLDESLEITQKSNYGVCSFSWEKADEKASKEQMVAEMMSAVKSGDASKGISASKKGYYSVGFNFSNLQPKTKKEALDGFNLIIKRLTEGVTINKEAVKEKMEEMGIDGEKADQYMEDEYSFKSEDLAEMDGVGEKAVWSGKSGQLTVLSGTNIFFLNVRASGDEEKARKMAADLANVIINNL